MFLFAFGERSGDNGKAKTTALQLPLKQNWPFSKRCTTFWLEFLLFFQNWIDPGMSRYCFCQKLEDFGCILKYLQLLVVYHLSVCLFNLSLFLYHLLVYIIYVSIYLLSSIIYLYTFIVIRIILLDMVASNYVYLGDAPPKYFISLSRDALP